MMSTPSQRIAHAARSVSSEMRLVDGPLIDTYRSERLSQMVVVLVETDAFRNRDDARLALRMAKFSSFEVEANLDDVMQAAMQTVVAREISQP